MLLWRLVGTFSIPSANGVINSLGIGQTVSLAHLASEILLTGVEIGQSYRMSGDITATFSDTGKDCACKTAYCLNTGYAGCSVLTIIRKMREIAPFSKPGSFADMDMLEIGNGNMTLHQQRTHVSFWAALKSPLIIGADISKLSNESLSVLKNKNIIQISQDSLGKAALFVPELSTEKVKQVWAGELSGGRTVVLLLNELNSTQTFELSVRALPALNGRETWGVEDVWSKEVGQVKGNYTVAVETHETKVLVFSRN